jgi:hypothetical protein
MKFESKDMFLSFICAAYSFCQPVVRPAFYVRTMLVPVQPKLVFWYLYKIRIGFTVLQVLVPNMALHPKWKVNFSLIWLAVKGFCKCTQPIHHNLGLCEHFSMYCSHDHTQETEMFPFSNVTGTHLNVYYSLAMPILDGLFAQGLFLAARVDWTVCSRQLLTPSNVVNPFQQMG